MSCTPSAMLNAARSQIGFREGRKNDNKYGIWYGWNHVPYCAIGLSWCAEVAHGSDIMGGKWAYCPSWVSHWRQVGRWHAWTETPRPGDIVFFNWAGSHGLADHVGIVESVSGVRPGSRTLTTIEFNTSSGTGSQSDGGGVYRRRRSDRWVVGYGRPAYKSQSRPTPIPSRGGGHSLMPLVVDGVWGKMTTQHVQVWAGVRPDGEIGPVTRQAVQRKLGVTADGAWGPLTHRALQRRVGVADDGVWGALTVKALQRFLNRTV